MIHPTESLALSMHANPGVYAVLAGSGVSRAAQMPTGWEVTLDLLRKLATLRGQKCDPDPEQWYSTTTAKEPNYSDLLDALCKTPAERHQLLRSYWAPGSADDPDDDAKRPTAAHRAIAALAAQNFIRVILTTNFDRLFETALDDAGIEPTVLSTPDQVESALPLIHSRCCVVKLHGDYRDPRIRNTRAELDCYHEDFDRLLDRIFDEFGLIVCGWSAVWDIALCKALRRAVSRRFTTYWAAHGEVEDEARRLIDHRRAELIPITGADEFFGTLQEHVESLQEFARPHPLTTEATLARLKRYLSEPRYRIKLLDLVDGVVERAVETTSGETFALDSRTPANTASATKRVRCYESACSTLLTLAPVSGFWAEEEHVALWQRALNRLGSLQPAAGNTIWLELRRYPAALLLYGLGIGAIESGRLWFLGRLLETQIREAYREDRAAALVLPPFCLFDGDGQVMRILEGAGRYAPLNDWMHKTLRPYAARVVLDDSRYTCAFDKLEILIALANLRIDPEDTWPPLGAFGHRDNNRKRILQEIKESILSRHDESPFVKCGIFGDTADACKQKVLEFELCVAKLRPHGAR